jgi:hypothetical protein
VSSSLSPVISIVVGSRHRVRWVTRRHVGVARDDHGGRGEQLLYEVHLLGMKTESSSFKPTICRNYKDSSIFVFVFLNCGGWRYSRTSWLRLKVCTYVDVNMSLNSIISCQREFEKKLEGDRSTITDRLVAAITTHSQPSHALQSGENLTLHS